MGKANVWIERFEPASAHAETWRGFHRLSNAIRAEWWPDWPPRPLPVLQRNLLAVPPVWGLRWWVAWRRGGLVAGAELELSTTPENRHLAWCDIYVHPDHRRQGIGTALLHTVAELARDDGRKLLTFATAATAPSGEAFARKLGAKPGLVNHTNRLRISDVDPALLRAWIERAPREEFSLGFWEGPYPEEDLAEVCRMHEVMNTAPRGELEMEDFHWTPELIREQEESLRKRGVVRWTVYARHRATGRIAGFTEVAWDPSEPEILHQWGTGVFPEFRGHGLGKWLKAEMLERVLAGRPEVRYVITGNAGSNAPMLKINHELGFRLYNTVTLWQLPVEEALAACPDSAK